MTAWSALLFAGFAVLLFVAEDSLLRSRLRARADDELLADVRQFEALYHAYGLEVLRDEFLRESESRGAEDVALVFRSPNGTVLASSELTYWSRAPWIEEPPASLAPGELVLRRVPVPGTDRGARMVTAAVSDGNTLQIAVSLADDQDLLNDYRRVFALVVVGMLAFGLGLSWILTGRIVRGVRQVTEAAARIRRTDLSARVPVGDRGREIEELSLAFNDMLDRIDHLVTEMREVTDSVAHDLRRPLTAIRGTLEHAVTSATSQAEFREAAGVAIEECDRLVGMIDGLLEIAEAEAGLANRRLENLEFGSLVQDACELFLPVAEDKGVILKLDLADTERQVSGDRRALQRAVANVLDNAIKYTPDGGRVTVGLRYPGRMAELTVRDTGCGIDAADRPHVFERFFRADRSRSTPGNGLGLAFARAVCRSHGGTVELESTAGQGTEVRLRLPARP
jgi:signal transduction histidine kinase